VDSCLMIWVDGSTCSHLQDWQVVCVWLKDELRSRCQHLALLYVVCDPLSHWQPVQLIQNGCDVIMLLASECCTGTLVCVAWMLLWQTWITLHLPPVDICSLPLLVQVKKQHIHARVTSLPVCPELTRDTLPKSSDIGCFLSISGNSVLRYCTLSLRCIFHFHFDLIVYSDSVLYVITDSFGLKFILSFTIASELLSLLM